MSTPRDAGCVEGGAFVCMVLGEHGVRGISVRGHAAQIYVQRGYIRMRVQPIGIVAVAAQVPNSKVLSRKGSQGSHSSTACQPVHYKLSTRRLVCIHIHDTDHIVIYVGHVDRSVVQVLVLEDC